MALFLSLALLLVEPATDFDAVARTFVDALIRRDLEALPRDFFLGSAPEILEIYTDVSITSWRVVSIEPGAESTRLLMELEGTAVSIGTGRTVPWPRWWVLEVKPGMKGSQIASAMVLERRLALDSVMASDAERDRLVRERQEIDLERYFVQLANVASDRGDTACNTLLWLLRESHDRGMVVAEITTMHLISSLALDDWNSADALPPALEALALAEKAGLPEPLADSYFTVGVSYWMANRLAEAVAFLRRPATLIGQYDDYRLPLRALYMASHIELRRSNLRQALALAQEHAALLERYPSRRASMDNAFQLAVVHGAVGSRDIAARYDEIAQTIAREIRDRRSEAMAAFNRASVGFEEPAALIARLEEALQIGGATLGPEVTATMQLSIAALQRDRGDLDSADATLTEVLAAAHASKESNLLAAAYAGRSELRMLQGRFADALADARESRRFAQSEGATGRTRMGDPLLLALNAEGRALRALGQTDAAAATWRTAIDASELLLMDHTIDESGSTVGLAKMLEPYRQLLDLYVEDGCTREALVIAERMRSRSLRESLRHGRVDLSAGLDEPRRQRERELETTMAEVNLALLAATDPETLTRLETARDEARLALRRFRTEIYLTNPEIGRRRAEAAEEYDAWAPAIAPGELVLELASTSDSLLLFALEGTNINVHRIEVSTQELDKQVTAFVAALEGRDFSYRAAARALHDLLLGPVSAQLAKAERVRIVPDGGLWRLPFQALIDSGGKHLAERVAISYSPSLALSQRPTGGRTPSRTLLAMADPAITSMTAQATRSLYRDTTLGRLPEAATEARSIARLYKDAQVRVGSEAREAVFKSDAGAFRVLHLAAHSIVDDGAPMFSSIVLATSGATPEDGLLEAREIADLKLGADIAVLSACETARGRITPGEGLVGLSWAFLAAGVPTTVVSQWKVGSASTAELMVLFHRRLRDGAPAAEALQNAMVELRKDRRWRHPFYWAPFVVIENVGGR